MQDNTGRNGARVRRHSGLRGRCEAGLWRPVERQHLRAVLLRARRFDLAGRVKGRRNGPLGHIGIEVLDLLCNLVDCRTGRLEPSLEWLCLRLNRCRDAVVRALAALRLHGFLVWVRRVEPVDREGAGPRLRQTSNAYRILVAPAVEPVLPDDVAQDRAERRQWIADLQVQDFVRAVISDDGLSRALERLAARIGQCESAGRGEGRSYRHLE